MVGRESLEFKIKGYPMVDKCRVKLKEHGCMKMRDPCLEVKIKGMPSLSTWSYSKGFTQLKIE
jgi:hypothetical protein